MKARRTRTAIAAKNIAYREGWPKVPTEETREAYLKRRMRGKRYDDPGQIQRTKGDRRD